MRSVLLSQGPSNFHTKMSCKSFFLIMLCITQSFENASCQVCRHEIPDIQCPNLGAKKSTQTFFVQSFSTTLRVMDVRAENRGRPRQKVGFPAAPVVGRKFLTPRHPGARVRNVRGKSGPKSLCLCCFFFPENCVVAIGF